MNNIEFVSNSKSNLTYNPIQRIETFYQICQFRNPKTKLYDSRKIIFNQDGEIIKTFERKYYRDELERFIKSNKHNKYKIYPVYNISYIEYPNSNDIINVMSNLTN